MNARAVSLQRGEQQQGALGVVLDLLRLCKPRITVMVIVTALGGMWLASRISGAEVTLLLALTALTGITLVVASANVLNMYIERDVDALMERTRNRPLPTGRLAPAVALWWGVALGAVSIPLLGFSVNWLTAGLAGVSLFLYVLVYTPLKRVAPIALMVGAVPGAAPPLLGWTAATGTIDAAGVALFAVLFFWQLPHFLAIATFRCEEYQRAGIRVLPAVRGQRATRIQAVLFTVALLISSLVLVPLGVSGPLYLINAIVLGGLFLAVSLNGFPTDKPSPVRWARSVFAVSLVYLPLMIAAMMVSA
jgi:protoheme IX farnesyltransferase